MIYLMTFIRKRVFGCKKAMVKGGVIELWT